MITTASIIGKSIFNTTHAIDSIANEKIPHTFWSKERNAESRAPNTEGICVWAYLALPQREADEGERGAAAEN
jgi:hypothetical protein